MTTNSTASVQPLLPGLLAAPTPKPAPAPPPVSTSAACDTSTKQQDPKDNRTAPREPPKPKEFWLEGACDDPRIWWPGRRLRGRVIGLANGLGYPPVERKKRMYYVSDGDRFFTFKQPSLRDFLAVHRGHIFVSSNPWHPLHYRVPSDERRYHDTRYVFPQDPYVDLYLLYWVLFLNGKVPVRQPTNLGLAKRLLRRGCGDAATRKRLRALLCPARPLDNWNNYVCTMHGQALAGVLLYRLMRHGFLDATNDYQRSNQEKLARIASKLPSTVLADLRDPILEPESVVRPQDAGIQ